MSLRRFHQSRARHGARKLVRKATQLEHERNESRKETHRMADRLQEHSKKISEYEKQLTQFGQLVCAIHGVTPGLARRWHVTPEAMNYFGAGRISGHYGDHTHCFVFTVEAGRPRRPEFEWFDWKREW